MARQEDAELKDEYEGIARRHLEDAEDRMSDLRRLSFGDRGVFGERTSASLFEEAKLHAEIALAAATLLAAINNTTEDKHA